MSFSVDGIKWKYPCTVERTSEMQASDISGLMLDGSYFNDVFGTYLKYDIALEVPMGRETEYNQIYEAITNPISQHNFIVPYGGGDITVVGRVESISDIYVRRMVYNSYTKKREEVKHWKGIRFSIIANHPTKYIALDDVITNKGVPSLPSDSKVNIGAVYIYGNSGWEELADADNYQY